MKIIKADFETQASVHLEGRDIYFFGGVFAISAMQIIHYIHTLEKEAKKPIRIFLNCEGGNISDGFAIYDALTQSKCHITTIGIGVIESMGIIIFLAGKERYCYPNCRFMNH
ncbi:MAG: ATP-dependent Clp protease proteolytic subunit, partial [Nanoarchaeota archaeon]